jgi:hypothetical protein
VLKTAKFLMAIAWMMGASGVARANTIETLSHTTPTQSVPRMDTFLLDGFNTSLGTLDAITLTLDATGTAEVDVFNSLGSPESFANASAKIPISGTAVSFGVNAFPGLLGSANNSVSVLAADFVDYEGLGLIVSVKIDAGRGTYGGSANPGVYFGGSSTAGAVTTVSYMHDPWTTRIPEPATMSLLGGALLGISFVLKRFVPQK